MENKRYSLGYEDTDKKIEIDIYGLVFEINNINNSEYYEKIDRTNSNSVEKELEKILGIGSIDKINKKREQDGKGKLTIDIELGMLGKLLEIYSNATIDNFEDSIDNTISKVNNRVNNMNRKYNNREQRRYNYNKRNNHNRRYY